MILKNKKLFFSCVYIKWLRMYENNGIEVITDNIKTLWLN